MGSKRILIITYTFPPYSGVGGRRWAKFAKYLHKAGNKVKVITAKSGFVKNSPWTKDVEALEINYHESRYPKILGIQPKTIFGKVLYRIALIYMKLTTQGNFYDKASKWQKSLQKAVIQKVEEGLDVIYVTCAPFHLAYNLIPLVNQHRNIKWIVDFRDPWTTNRTSYGFDELNETRKQFELNAERAVVKAYDEVISVADPMTEYFKTLVLEQSNKFRTVINGYDKDDFPQRNKSQFPDPDYFTFVFAGTLYDKAIPAFELFCKAVQSILEEDPKLHAKLKFIFIGVEQVKVDLLKHPNIKRYPFLPFDQVRDFLYKSNAGLLFLTSDIDWSFSTKFTDYLGANLRTLVVSENESKTGAYCIQNKIGLALNVSNCIHFSTNLRNEVSGLKNTISFSKSNFMLSSLTKKLLA